MADLGVPALNPLTWFFRVGNNTSRGFLVHDLRRNPRVSLKIVAVPGGLKDDFFRELYARQQSIKKAELLIAKRDCVRDTILVKYDVNSLSPEEWNRTIDYLQHPIVQIDPDSRENIISAFLERVSIPDLFVSRLAHLDLAIASSPPGLQELYYKDISSDAEEEFDKIVSRLVQNPFQCLRSFTFGTDRTLSLPLTSLGSSLIELLARATSLTHVRLSFLDFKGQNSNASYIFHSLFQNDLLDVMKSNPRFLRLDILVRNKPLVHYVPEAKLVNEISEMKEIAYLESKLEHEPFENVLYEAWTNYSDGVLMEMVRCSVERRFGETKKRKRDL